MKRNSPDDIFNNFSQSNSRPHFLAPSRLLPEVHNANYPIELNHQPVMRQGDVSGALAQFSRQQLDHHIDSQKRQLIGSSWSSKSDFYESVPMPRINIGAPGAAITVVSHDHSLGTSRINNQTFSDSVVLRSQDYAATLAPNLMNQVIYPGVPLFRQAINRKDIWVKESVYRTIYDVNYRIYDKQKKDPTEWTPEHIWSTWSLAGFMLTLEQQFDFANQITWVLENYLKGPISVYNMYEGCGYPLDIGMHIGIRLIETERNIYQFQPCASLSASGPPMDMTQPEEVIQFWRHIGVVRGIPNRRIRHPNGYGINSVLFGHEQRGSVLDLKSTIINLPKIEIYLDILS